MATNSTSVDLLDSAPSIFGLSLNRKKGKGWTACVHMKDGSMTPDCFGKTPMQAIDAAVAQANRAAPAKAKANEDDDLDFG